MPNENDQTKPSSPHTSSGNPATLTPSQSQVAIIGGGWAGLACAVALCQQNYNVTLFESSPQLGGRARSIKWNNKTVDNGQHLMIGAYQQMLDLLNLMQANTNQLFKRIPHRMLMLNAKTGKTEFDLQLPTYPAPLHLLFGVLNTPSLSLKEKLLLLLRFNKLLNTKIEKDISVSEWLNKAKLPAPYTKQLLEPVCLAALTTHPHQASAKAFQSVLQQTFNAAASFTDLLIPTTDLTQVFPALAEQFILQHGGSIKIRSKVQQLQCKNKHIESISVNNETLFFDEFILATPPNVTAKLLSNIQACQKICTQINQLKYEPVCTLYLQFKQAVSLPYPMLGMVNGTSEWVFERGTSGNNDILAVVISAQGEHLKIPEASLVETVYNELSNNAKNMGIKNLPELIDSKLITEKRATFQCHPNVDNNRPGIRTNLSNLNLCGDYVYIEENNAPGLPSTLEGALRSGVKCAQYLITPNDNP